MTLQDPTPLMGFWVFHDPTEKRGKEMTVREISYKENTKQLKTKVKFHTAVWYKILFADLAMTALKGALVPVDDLIKHLGLNSVTLLCQPAKESFDLKTRPPPLSPAINLYGSD